MARIKIDRDRCKGCLLCISFCPKGLIKKESSLNKRGVNPVRFENKDKACLGCLQCALICPEVCIEVYK